MESHFEHHPPCRPIEVIHFPSPLRKYFIIRRKHFSLLLSPGVNLLKKYKGAYGCIRVHMGPLGRILPKCNFKATRTYNDHDPSHCTGNPSQYSYPSQCSKIFSGAPNNKKPTFVSPYSYYTQNVYTYFSLCLFKEKRSINASGLL